MISFAGNGEKYFILQNFNTLAIENDLTVESQENLNPTATYDIQIRIFICDGETSTDWFETATGPNGTSCVDENQLEPIKQMYIQMYSIYYPNVCNIVAYADKRDDCDL